MKTLYTILMLCIGCFSHAQIQIPISSIDSGGDSVNNGSLSMVYSIGEVAVAEVNSGNLYFSEGFIGKSFNSSTTLACLDSPENMVSWWTGDDTSQDLYGNNDGTPQGGVAYGQGVVNKAFLLDGVNDVVVVPASTDLDLTGDMTLELWVKQTGFNPENMVVCKGAQNEPVVFSMYFSGATFNCAFQDTNEAIIELGGPSFEDGRWHHYAYVRQGNQHIIYADGFDFGWRTFTSLPASSAGLPLTIGAQYNKQNDNYGDFFGGSIDEIGVYNRALSETEIQSISNAGSDGKCVNPLSVAEVIDTEDSIKIYPNPVKNKCTLDISKSTFLANGSLKLQIFDLSGRLVKQVDKINTLKRIIDINNLNSGMYLYQLSGNGSNVASGKIIKK